MGCNSSALDNESLGGPLFDSIMQKEMQSRHELTKKCSCLLLLDECCLPNVMGMMARADLDALSFCCKDMAKMLIQAVMARTFIGTKEETLVVIGGCCSSEPTVRGDMEQFSTHLSRWQIMQAKLNQSRCGATVTMQDGELFIFGGATQLEGASNHPERIFMDLQASSDCVDTVEKFSVGASEEASSWEQVASLGTPMMHAGACSFDQSETDVSSRGGMYVVGGCVKTKKNTEANGCLYRVTRTSGKHGSYHAEEGTSPETPRPNPLRASCFKTNQLPIIGGCFSSPRTGASVVQHNQLMYVIGGCSTQNNSHKGGTSLSSMMAYDPAADNWEPRPAMGVPRWGASAVIFNGKIFVIGGVVVSSQAHDLSTTMPFNGPRRPAVTNVVEAFDIATESWSRVAPLRHGRTAASAVVFKGKLYVLGGYQFLPLKTVECYDAVNNRWERCPSMRKARAGAVAAVVEKFNCTWTGAGSQHSGAKKQSKKKQSKKKQKELTKVMEAS